MYRLKKILKWSLVVVATPIVLLYVINLFDESLNPEIMHFRPDISGQITDANNGYYYMVGIPAETGRDPQQAGKHYIDALNAAKNAGKYLDSEVAGKLESESLGQGKFEFKGKDYLACRYKDGPCIPVYQKNKQAILQQLRDNRVLIQRAEHLESFPHFAETMVASFEMPLAYAPLKSNLLLAKMALTADAGQISQALNSLQRSNRFWRIVLAETTTLIGKNWALAMVDRNITLATEIMARYSLSAKQVAIVQSMLKPLDQNELSMSNAIKGEFQYSDSILRYSIYSAREENDSFFGPKWQSLNYVLMPLWQTNAMRNDNLQFYRRYEQIGRFTSRELARYIKEKASAEINNRYAYHWNYVYNPLGKTLLSIAGPDYSLLGYIVRVHNLDARIRLMAVRFNILKNRIPRQRIPSYLDKIDASLRNPYTGEAPRWDSEKSTIQYSVISPKPEKLENQQFSNLVEFKI